ncbi:oplophorus-luciferin 2-monooxygenase non-catalytic subunit-like isoform X2 [Cherax quadricarinatus]|uniref:oplophorus-luciferin 2-monooxygenase non-catalytic subunit-like isoform X2 n=1 Tax=Cherax quadricarinatus TaxID=27406 RepID=UPI00387E88AB
MLISGTFLALLLVSSTCTADNGQDPASGHFVDSVRKFFLDILGRHVVGHVREIMEEVRNLPCPDDAVTFPCECTVNSESDFSPDLDCSEVESEEELATILSYPFPFRNFRNLTIVGNQNLTTLRRGVLGNTTFKEFYITGGALQEVETGALSSSYNTATVMNFEGNRLVVFPWGELSAFTGLLELNLNSNKISSFPALISDTLQRLDLSNNPLGLIPGTGFKATPDIETVLLDNVNMYEIIPGTFTGHRQLRVVSMNSNQLREVPADAIHFTAGFDLTYVRLSDNVITKVAVDAFIDNPLLCGCDIAWIMLNSSLLSMVDGRTTCSDGELMVNLSPLIYQDLC